MSFYWPDTEGWELAVRIAEYAVVLGVRLLIKAIREAV